MTKKFSLSYRVDSVTPSHTTMSVFCAMVLREYAHNNVTRGKAGDLTFRNEEVEDFLYLTQPNIISLGGNVTLELFKKYIGSFPEEYEVG